MGILSAMPEEVGVILDNLKNIEKSSYGDLEIFSGEWVNKEKKVFVTTAWSGWGKVSAARATARLLSKKIKNIPVEKMLFTGVAGAVDKRLKQWDIVLSKSVIQHDMDASPIFEKYVVPALKKKYIYPSEKMLNDLFNKLKKELPKDDYINFGNLYKGIIATGDMFISDRNKLKNLSIEIPNLFAVEMEGAAFAQVAQQEKVEWLVMRVISDNANEESVDDFNSFLEIYKFKSFNLIKCFLQSF